MGNLAGTLGLDRVCVRSTSEGQPCDSNAIEVGHPSLLNREVPGCQPCEEGTFCVSTFATLGRVGDPEPFRCARPCEEDGAADPSVCACQTSACVPAEDPGARSDGSAIADFFCSPCGRLNQTL